MRHCVTLNAVDYHGQVQRDVGANYRAEKSHWHYQDILLLADISFSSLISANIKPLYISETPLSLSGNPPRRLIHIDRPVTHSMKPIYAY